MFPTVPSSGKKESTRNRIAAEAWDQDPFLNTKLLYSKNVSGPDKESRLKASRELFQKEVDRAFTRFEEVKKSIVRILDAKRTPANASQIDSMKARIRTIRFEDPLKGGAVCQGGPNAFYQPAEHSFTLCPSVLMLPDETLRSIIAHELGHSIDPCSITSDLIEVTGEGKTGKSGPGDLGDLMNMTQGPTKKDFSPKIPSQESDSKDRRVNTSPEEIDEKLKGEYQSYSIKTLAPGIPIDRNPLKSVVECLGTKSSVEARKVDQKYIETAIRDRIKDLKGSGIPGNSSEITRLEDVEENLPSLVKQKGYCSGVLPSSEGESQFQEAFSDWVSGEVTAQTLKSAPPEDRKRLAFESVGFLPAVDCPVIDAGIDDYKKALLASLKCEKSPDESTPSTRDQIKTLEWVTAIRRDEHPFSSIRVNRILLANPETRKALGCKINLG
ncbi:MAG: hypothetical protein EBX52_09280, partial [Proteobacteria bacterium]|nr:hypothetical protein [Pseudomonadota bacterium]